MFADRPESLIPASTLWLSAAMWAAAWLVPIHELPWTAFHADLLCAAALALLSVGLLRHGDSRVHVPHAATAVALLTLVPGAQAIGGLVLFSGDAWMASLYLLGFAIAIVCGHVIARQGVDLSAPLAFSLAAVGGLSAVMALWQWLQWPPPHMWWRAMLPGDRPAANVGQSNLLATLLVLALLASLALHQTRRLRPILVCALVGLLSVGIAVTQSRTGLLALVVAVLWLWAMRRTTGLRISSGWIITLLAWLLLCVVAQPLLAQANQLPLGRPGLDTQLGPRQVHWATMLAATLQSPWLGYGWNQVAVAQASVPHLAFSGEFIEHSHNLVLDLLIWNGLPLGLLLICAMLWWVWQRARLCRTPAVALLLAGMWVLLVHAMTEYPLDYFGFLMLLGLLVGAVDALVLPAPAQTLLLPRRAAAAVTWMAASLVAWVTVEYISLEADHALMRMQWERPELVTAGPDAVPQVMLLTQLRALLVFMRMPLDMPLSTQQLSEMTRVSLRYGYAPVLTRQALAAQRNGRAEEAQAALARLCKTQAQQICDDARQQVAAAARTPAP
jgi:O-antigen ligase